MSNYTLVEIPYDIPKSRTTKLLEEFKYAWEKTSEEKRKEWAKESLKLFMKVTYRRGKGFVNALSSLGKNIANETIVATKSIKDGMFKSYAGDRKEKIIDFSKNSIKSTKKVLKNIVFMLTNRPTETGPILLMGLLGFFAGAGTEFGEKTWYDIDGGIPDLDTAVGGIGNHRSIFFHSMISAAVLETVVFSSVNAILIIHSNLPKEHDSFWDQVVEKKDWATAFVSGACVGIAYHLLLDGTIDGNKAIVDLPFSMPMEGHNAFFISNSIAEVIDFKNKGKI